MKVVAITACREVWSSSTIRKLQHMYNAMLEGIGERGIDSLCAVPASTLNEIVFSNEHPTYRVEWPRKLKKFHEWNLSRQQEESETTEQMLAGSSARNGLQPGWTRATVIVREDVLNTLRDYAYTERRTLKDVLDEALTAYVEEIDRAELLSRGTEAKSGADMQNLAAVRPVRTEDRR